MREAVRIAEERTQNAISEKEKSNEKNKENILALQKKQEKIEDLELKV